MIFHFVHVGEEKKEENCVFPSFYTGIYPSIFW